MKFKPSSSSVAREGGARPTLAVSKRWRNDGGNLRQSGSRQLEVMTLMLNEMRSTNRALYGVVACLSPPCGSALDPCDACEDITRLVSRWLCCRPGSSRCLSGNFSFSFKGYVAIVLLSGISSYHTALKGRSRCDLLEHTNIFHLSLIKKILCSEIRILDSSSW